MFDSDALIESALTNPDQTWELLDSFWRDQVFVGTADLVHYQAWATMLIELNIHAKARHFLAAQTVPVNSTGIQQEAYLTLPWFPVVLYRDRLVNQSFVLYGEGFDYASPEEIEYGEESGVPRFVLPLKRPWRSITSFCDAVTDTRVVIDQSQFTYDQDAQQVVFTIDPFAHITAKVGETSGRQYLVLWARNATIDLNVPRDTTGWVVKYDRASIEHYTETLRYIWELVLLGPSIGRYKTGMLANLGLPFALRDGQIEWVANDGYQWLISDGQGVYRTSAGVSPTVAGGDHVTVGQALTTGLTFLEYPDTITASSDTLPGLVIRVPLSTGVVASLSFGNNDTQWTYVAGRPSEFRFVISGDPEEIEQFWTDVQAYALANGIDLQTVYGLTIPVSDGPTGDPVNPMRRIITDLLHNSLFVASVELSTISGLPGGFHDRAQLLLPQDLLFVLQQRIGEVSDALDLGAATEDQVSYGYHTAVPTEVISTSGTDLTYNDYTPLVVIS